MRKLWPVLLFLSLTTCATLPTQARIEPALLATAWEISEWSALYQGVDIRIVEIPQFPAKVYILRVDPRAQTELVLTNPAVMENGWTRPQTVRDFALQNRVQIAINASFYQRRDQEPSVRSLGLWVVDGKTLGEPHASFSSFGVTASGLPVVLDPGDTLPELRLGIGGGVRLLKNGQIVSLDDDVHPRTALGFSLEPQWLYLAVADGRQSHSRGIGLRDLAQLLLWAGAREALNLDGGGSSTLVVQEKQGGHVLINSPWDNRFSGGERAVVNHIGIRALPLP